METEEIKACSGLEAAHNLVGVELDGGWRVVRKVPKEHGATGGHFSVCYEVQAVDGKKAFLKVLDLTRALAMPGDQLRNIQSLIETFNFERETLRICRESRVRRVAAAIADGKIEMPGTQFGVYYIIFELADGDIRTQLTRLGRLDVAWVLRSLHHTATALNQLHSRKIAHQDLKPSNVLVFGGKETKIADLGCADIKGVTCPRGRLNIAGDRSYAPPELLYGDLSGNDWERRRLGTDIYLFGSLITYVFTQVTTTAAIVSELDPSHRPGFWPHDYRTVIPYVRDAFGKAMSKVRALIAEEFRDDIADAIELLCDPDPLIRGHPKDIDASQFSLQRFVSLFDRLATQAEMQIRRR